MSSLIKTKTIDSRYGGKIGWITLNKPQALNAIDLDMISLISHQLDEWKNKPNIKAVFIDSSGEKAFCAGGDIVSMYKAMTSDETSSTDKLPEFIAQFFTQEYRLDYQIHTYHKPIIAWGNGIIMGGGLGLFAGASTKIVTQKSRIAMPEISIGLFPDVGASYFLNKMPAGIGKFLGLSGASINGADCKNIGLADHLLDASQKDEFIQQLSQMDNINLHTINDLCSHLASIDDSQHKADKHLEVNKGKLDPLITKLAPLQMINDPIEALTFLQVLAAENADNVLLKTGYENMLNGSPISACLVMQQLQRGLCMSLAECFRMELSMAFECGVSGEFKEGVRALLIDKDKQAKWLYSSISDVPESVIEAHFTRFSKPSDLHPLANLEQVFGEYDAN